MFTAANIFGRVVVAVYTKEPIVCQNLVVFGNKFSSSSTLQKPESIEDPEGFTFVN